MRETTSPEFFESLYRANSDPWNFAGSDYEQRRYSAIISALSDRHFRRAFEPGCSIGVLTAMLAPLCDSLLAIDVSETAVLQAQQRCREMPDVSIRTAGLPDGVPGGSFDLIIFSEIGYYFEEAELLSLGNSLVSRLDRGGVLLAAHWSGHSQDHILNGARVHELLDQLRGMRSERSDIHEGFQLQTWIRE